MSANERNLQTVLFLSRRGGVGTDEDEDGVWLILQKEGGKSWEKLFNTFF